MDDGSRTRGARSAPHDVPAPPSAYHSIGGWSAADGCPVFLARAIAKKPYRCPGCHDRMRVGDEHVLVRLLTPDPTSGHDHHHYHTDCAMTQVAARLRARRVFTAAETARDRLDVLAARWSDIRDKRNSR